jgi:hypothetical protein
VGVAEEVVEAGGSISSPFRWEGSPPVLFVYKVFVTKGLVPDLKLSEVRSRFDAKMRARAGKRFLPAVTVTV